ncbi:hypothetical protein BV898_04456 [Hypsibius exemplaris]|uniref:SUEL-type lectin domain-containing protein n=1 Tax=Hypsibius exemplaris TaxID=2072580 RepID=A0A1W0X2C8_HYPEX|nr:hypothetical protein BV898_04456 [Hypsibius exemplaris]
MEWLQFLFLACALIACQNLFVRGESYEDEKKRIKSMVLAEGDRGMITCPTGEVLRIKTAQYRVTGPKACAGFSTCRNPCPGNTVTQNLARRCDLKPNCPVAARSVSQRDDCSQSSPEPLAILYTCNDSEQAKSLGNPAVTYMEILQSPMCSFKRSRRFCEF